MQGNEKEAKLFILKSRDGQTGPISAVFDIKNLRFSDAPENFPTASHWTDKD
jgi:hypothetical protein